MLDIIRVRAQSWGVKVIFGIIILVFIFWGVGSMTGGTAHTVATVNDQAISAQEYSQELQRQFATFRQQMPELAGNPIMAEGLKNEVLQLMITSAIKQQEAKRLGIIVAPHELLAMIGKIGLFQDSAGKFDKTKYAEQLAARKIVPGDFEESYKKQIAEEKLQAYIALTVDVPEAEARNYFNFSLEKRKAEYLLFPVEDYKSKVTLADADIEKYYTDNKLDFEQPDRIHLDYLVLTPATLAKAYPVSKEAIAAAYEKDKALYRQQARYDSRQIFLRCPPEGSTEDNAAAKIAKAKALALDIIAQAKKGEDFADLAKKYSEDPNSAPLGGALGWMNKGQLPPEIDTAAFAMKKGEISAPVRSQFGFHIIKLDDKSDEQQQTLAQVEKDIAETLGVEKARADFEKVQAKAEEGLRVGKSLADMGKELGAAVESSGVVPVAELPALLSIQQSSLDILKNVPVGKIAPSPLEVKDGIVVVQVKERMAAAVTPLAEVRAQIVETLSAQKAQELARVAAAEALPAIAAGTVTPGADKLKEVENIVRVSPVVGNLGDAPELVSAIGSAPLQKWLPAAYVTPVGAVLVRPTASVAPSEEEWLKQKEAFLARYLQRKREEIVSGFMQDLQATAKITINADLLKQIRMQ